MSGSLARARGLFLCVKGEDRKPSAVQNRKNLAMDKSRRAVVEVRDDLHREIRKLALLNDLCIYELASAIIKEFLED